MRLKPNTNKRERPTQTQEPPARSPRPESSPSTQRDRRFRRPAWALKTIKRGRQSCRACTTYEVAESLDKNVIRRIKSSRKDNKYNTHDILSAWRAYIRRTRQYLVADQREKGTKRRCNAPNLPPPRKKTASESWVSGFKQKQASSVNAPLSNSLDIVGSSRPPAGQHYPIRPIQLSTTFLNGSSRFYRLLTRACLSFFRLARPASTKEISALDHETIAHKRPRNGYPLTHQPATYINQSHRTKHRQNASPGIPMVCVRTTTCKRFLLFSPPQFFFDKTNQSGKSGERGSFPRGENYY